VGLGAPESNQLASNWLQSNLLAITTVMPYTLKVYIYLGVWFTAATVLADQWLRYFSAPFIVTFAAAYATIMILFGRWFFGRKTL
jgi:hypothetical protein